MFTIAKVCTHHIFSPYSMGIEKAKTQASTVRGKILVNLTKSARFVIFLANMHRNSETPKGLPADLLKFFMSFVHW